MLGLMEMFKENPWLWPAVLFAAGLLAGLVAEYIAIPVALRVAKRTNWELDDIFIGSLHGVALIWLVCAGAHLAVHAMPIKHLAVATIVDKAKVIVDANSVSAASSQSLAEKLDIINVLDGLIKVIFIASLTIFAMRVAVAALAFYTRKTGSATQGVTLFTSVTKIIIVILGGLILMDSFGYSITPILTALGVGGLAVALALQDTLSNLFAGFHIIASRQIKPGDYVKLEGGQEGYVADINWRNTTIKTPSNNMTIVPNSKLASSIITNFDKPDRELAVGLDISVALGSDLAKVEKVTCEVADAIIKRTEGIVNTGPAAIRYGAITETGVTFGVGFRMKGYMDQYLVKHEFIKALHERYKKEGIEIAVPQRQVAVTKESI